MFVHLLFFGVLLFFPAGLAWRFQGPLEVSGSSARTLVEPVRLAASSWLSPSVSGSLSSMRKSHADSTPTPSLSVTPSL